MEIVAGVGKVPQVFPGCIVNLNPAFFPADDGDVEIPLRIHIDLPMGITDGLKPFGRCRPALLEIIFVGGGVSRERDAGKQCCFHKFQISKSKLQKE